jgi:hypothetical protein
MFEEDALLYADEDRNVVHADHAAELDFVHAL